MYKTTPDFITLFHDGSGNAASNDVTERVGGSYGWTLVTGMPAPPLPLASGWQRSPMVHLTSSLLSLNRESCLGTRDDFTTSFLYFSLFSTALWDLPKYRPVHFLMLSSHIFLCPPCLLPPFTVPCKMVLARPDERET